MTVNARGPWLVARAVLPLMIAAGRGRIVNLASDAALYGSPRLAHYIASKGASIALTRAMARETRRPRHHRQRGRPGPHRRRVRRADPRANGTSCTGTTGRCRGPSSPADLVGMIAFLVGAESGYITGQPFVVNGGFVMH